MKVIAQDEGDSFLINPSPYAPPNSPITHHAVTTNTSDPNPDITSSTTDSTNPYSSYVTRI